MAITTSLLITKALGTILGLGMTLSILLLVALFWLTIFGPMYIACMIEINRIKHSLFRSSDLCAWINHAMSSPNLLLSVFVPLAITRYVLVDIFQRLVFIPRFVCTPLLTCANADEPARPIALVVGIG